MGFFLIMFFFMHESSLISLLLIGLISLFTFLGPGYCISSLNLLVDSFNSGLIYMSVICFLSVFMSLSETLTTRSVNLYVMLVVFSIMMISSSNTLVMYLWFELSLVPIFLLLIYDGYQPERMSASVYMVIYTLGASLPLLGVLLVFSVSFFVSSFNPALFSGFSSSLFREVFAIMWLLAFLVKFPIYGVHFWLPLAHVQAPTGGSMMLAAVLLKLGGVGVFKVMCFLSSINSVVLVVCSWALLGGVISSFLCMVSQEMKVLVALSSVAHMSLSILVICTGLSLSPSVYLLILIAHGYSSSAMFLFVGVVYLQVGYRSMTTLFNMGGSLPGLWVWSLLAILANMGVPPTLNFIAEIGAAMLVVNLEVWYLLFSILLMFLAVMFSVMLFSQVFMGMDFRQSYNSSFNQVNFLISSSFFILSLNYFLSPLLYLSI